MNFMKMVTEVKDLENNWVIDKEYLFGNNNNLFALFADVDNDDDIIPISFPKGLPADCSQNTLDLIVVDNNYFCSFLTLKEIVDYKIPDVASFYDIINIVERYDDCDYENVRFVFWFSLLNVK